MLFCGRYVALLNPSIAILSAPDARVAEIVRAALVRSFSPRQVDVDDADAGVGVFIEPDDGHVPSLERILAGGGKAIVFGTPAPRFAAYLELNVTGDAAVAPDEAAAHPDDGRPFDVSAAEVRWSEDHPLSANCPIRARPLARFDFEAEWNNLGFGPIRADGSPWAIGPKVDAAGAVPLAALVVNGSPRGVYASFMTVGSGAALWFNRSVGPVDSLEWRVIEQFVSDFNCRNLVCLPCLRDVPVGFDAAATMRLDCDEAVASGRPVFDYYRQRGLPISLAVCIAPAITDEPADVALMEQVCAAGGSVLPHSMRHLPQWGGDEATARMEIRASREWIERSVAGASPVRFVVSPFHQNPTFAVQAMRDEGIEGFVGGIACNDPEYLLGRAGVVPFVDGVVTHSEQSMLHGDIDRRQGGSVDVFKQSFDQHVRAGSIYGYLDHPISPRYDYGWGSEERRIAAHGALLDHIQATGRVWFASLGDALAFIVKRSKAQIGLDDEGELVVEGVAPDALPGVAVGWKGQWHG